MSSPLEVGRPLPDLSFRRRLSIVLMGYLTTASSISTYVVVARKSERMDNAGNRRSIIPRPRVYNTCFAVLTIGMAGSMIVSTRSDLIPCRSSF